MSLINKMLQDLDARGSAPGASAQSNLKSVTHERNPQMVAVGIAAAVALALALAAGIGYWWVKRNPAPMVIGPTVTAPATAIQPMPPEVVDNLPSPTPIIDVQPVPAPAPEQEAAPEAEPLAPVEVASIEKPKRAVRVAAAPKPVVEEARAATPPRAALVRMQPAAEAGRQMTARQRAESEYNRALANLQDGRIGDAMAGFEQAISIESRHEAARQTLVGLLVERGRKGPAMRVLQDGLRLDPRQPAMAMLLARLQIEGGTSGIDTLMRTLPHAQGNGEYHAFLAGALARDERHREAADQYQAALRTAPGNGVWWMGLGMSLQADMRTAEALVAYDRAIQSSALTPQLRAFVERNIALLSR
ncbi:tetratricopeptide repeat protein [Massilia soli]|uniref:Tetratricopeptide repeat protein n=1 Tax=Massilia soli TaxID=2792854 RepID=A0ABS7SNM8_9BURK|nr:tetratricopeptide repeat protein [Massilia soli]MBZ2207529.1 tetratricopeptide repeat protein [Massilia soli]